MISIITVNYKQLQLTIDFLKSVRDCTTNFPVVEVIVVDNASEENHEHHYRSVIPEVVYIRSSENLGFAGGNNLGIKQAKGEYLLLLNNDTEITADLLAQLKHELDVRPEVGLVSPLLLYFEDKRRVQYAGYSKMNYITGRNKGRGTMELDTGQYDAVSEETGYCHGAAMMCRKRDLNKVGLMDERYFLYYEELDWCEKFKQAGFKSWFCGAARIYHKESMSVGKESALKTYFMARNRMLFIRKNTSWATTLCFGCFFVLVASSKQAIRYLFQGKLNLLKWHYKGIWWNFTHSKDSSSLGYEV